MPLDNSLSRVGFFFESTEQEQRSELERMRRSQETPEESLILNYLRQGIDAGFSMTVEFDVLCSPPKFLGPALLKSDGEWIWPASLSYFVETYHLGLPADFIQHMAENQWQIPQDRQMKSYMPEGHVEM